MFLLARNTLEDIARNKVGIKEVTFHPQQHGGGRRCDIFTLPARNRLAFTKNYQASRIRKWKDWKDTNTKGEPKLKERLIAAEQTINFRVVIIGTKPEEVDKDFNNFIRNVPKNIYDGEVAYYIDPDGNNATDNKGNKIEVSLNNYDFNDNKFYGALTNKVIIDFLFEGAIYHPDREMSSKQLPATWAVPEVKDVTTS